MAYTNETLKRINNANARRKYRANRDNVPYALTNEYIRQLEIDTPYCCVTGQLLAYGGNPSADNKAHLDKIIPELGYVPGNVRFISHRANRMKADNTTETLISLLADRLRVTPQEIDNRLADLLNLRNAVEATEETSHYEDI